MKKLFYLFLLVPVFLFAQEASEGLVIENGMITAHPAKISEFEAGVAAHNKKYHADPTYGARVYTISNGQNVGKYMWVMGPLPWSAFDDRPAAEGHDEDWNANVAPYMLAEGDQTYWKFHPEFSNFPADFDLKYISVFMVDFKRFKFPQMIEILTKVKKVRMEKYADWPYGVYTNEMPDDWDGRDMAFVDFFNTSSWMGREDTFPQDFNAVHGEGSFMEFLKMVEDATNGSRVELWVYREDLSGLGPLVPAAPRQ